MSKIVLMVTASLVIIFFVLFIKKVPETSDINNSTMVANDTYSKIQKSNPIFSKGIEQNINGDYMRAIESFKKSKELASTNAEREVIDFNIASAKFNLSRASGTESYMSMAKDDKYTDRIRAYAMIQAYLMYVRFNDENILRQIAKENEITWTTKKEVINNYMLKTFSLYPFALPLIVITNNEIDKNKDNLDKVKNIHSLASTRISESLDEMKNNPGEATVYTSSMLGKAKLLARLHIEFNIVSKEEVESSFEQLINYDQEKGYNVNKQYTLLAYANFESATKDYIKATKIINILLSAPLELPLQESLNKSKIKVSYPDLFKLTQNTDDTKVKTFIADH